MPCPHGATISIALMSSDFIPAIKISCSYANHQDMHMISHLLSAQDHNCCNASRLNLCSLLVILHSQNNLLYFGATKTLSSLNTLFLPFTVTFVADMLFFKSVIFIHCFLFFPNWSCLQAIEIALVRVTNAFQVEKSNSHTSLLTLTSHLAQLITTFIDTFLLLVVLQI